MKRIVLLLGVTALLTACGGGGSSKVGKFEKGTEVSKEELLESIKNNRNLSKSAHASCTAKVNVNMGGSQQKGEEEYKHLLEGEESEWRWEVQGQSVGQATYVLNSGYIGNEQFYEITGVEYHYYINPFGMTMKGTAQGQKIQGERNWDAAGWITYHYTKTTAQGVSAVENYAITYQG